MNMKQRTNSYLKTFPNTPEGIQSYTEFVKILRTFVKGGKLSKKFRGGDRKKNSTRFDVYLHNTWDGMKRVNSEVSNPSFSTSN